MGQFGKGHISNGILMNKISYMKWKLCPFSKVPCNPDGGFAQSKPVSDRKECKIWFKNCFPQILTSFRCLNPALNLVNNAYIFCCIHQLLICNSMSVLFLTFY